jgi:hypothetical protein
MIKKKKKFCMYEIEYAEYSSRDVDRAVRDLGVKIFFFEFFEFFKIFQPVAVRFSEIFGKDLASYF